MRAGKTLALLCAVVLSCGCFKQIQLPPQAEYTELQPSGRAARPPDCNMPVLRHEPLADFTRVGLIEGRGSRYTDEEDVLRVVKQRACEGGADAVVILTSQSQTTEAFVGYFIDADAIIYGKTPNIPSGPSMTH
ncbi:MAG TPA: hypothetical protein VEJ86_02360 [Candidatus Binataceae bacterium]|nr:hypothetical protein [Candidatus Binataceae bacterium]